MVRQSAIGSEVVAADPVPAAYAPDLHAGRALTRARLPAQVRGHTREVDGDVIDVFVGGLRRGLQAGDLRVRRRRARRDPMRARTQFTVAATAVAALLVAFTGQFLVWRVDHRDRADVDRALVARAEQIRADATKTG